MAGIDPGHEPRNWNPYPDLHLRIPSNLAPPGAMNCFKTLASENGIVDRHPNDDD